jgi:hypothetical protein
MIKAVVGDKEMERPVICFRCGEKLYYANEDNHEPEYTIYVVDNYKCVRYYHVHQHCWDNFWRPPKTKGE